MGYSTPSGAVIRMGVEGADESVRQVESVGASFKSLSKTVESAFKTLATTVGVGGGLAGVIQMSDAYTKYTAQVRLATQSQGEYQSALAEVKRISSEAQQSLEGTGTLYARIANGTRELGVSQARVAQITEAVNLSLKVSGATAEEAASAQLQLSQSFASGTLRGEEFNAVNEAAPRLMLALADGIGVPVGALKEMASNGLITSGVMATVLPQALEKLRAEAAQIQTIGGAFTVLKNNVMEFTAEHASANGTVALLTTGIGLLANNINVLFGVIQTVTAAKIGTWLAGWATQTYAKVSADRAAAASTLASASADLAAARSSQLVAAARVAELRVAIAAAEGNVALQLSLNGLIPAEARLAAAAETTTAALLAQTAAQRAASVGTGLMTGALGLLGGPIGAVITVLGLAATAWSVWGRSAEENNKKSAEVTVESTADILLSLDKQIEKISERNRLAKLGGVTVTQDSPAAGRMAELLAEVEKVNKAEGEYAKLDLSAKQAIVQSLARQYNELLDKAEALKKVTAEQLALTNKKNLGQWMLDYATNAEKLSAELKKAKKELGDEFTPELESRIRKAYETKDAGAAKELTAYDSLIAASRTKTAENKLEAAAGMNATESQKAAIKLDQDLAAGKLKLSADRVAHVRALLLEQAASEAVLKVQKAEKDVTSWIEQSTDARLASAAALKVEYDLYGKIGDVRDVAMISIRAEAELEKFLTAAKRDGKPISDEMISRMKAEMAARVGVEQATLAQGKALAYAAQLKEQNQKTAVDSISDPRARAQAQLAIDADVWSQRIKMAGDGTAAQKVLQTEYDTWYKNQQDRILVEVDLTRATQLLKIMEAVDEAAKQAASGMEESFGRVGASIGGLTTSLTGFQRQQAAIAAQLAASIQDSKADPKKIAQANALAVEQSAQAQMKSYGDMANAAKGFFKENSIGYKALEATEKTYRAFEMAMAIESMAKKILFKETEVTANVALNGTKLAGEATASAASTALAGTEASAWGITAVVKALASLPFPANLAAGAATLAAVVAVGAKILGGGGNGGGASAADVQKTQGTGSVFGDSSAKSDSIRRSIEQLTANSSDMLPINQGMLTALQNIESSMTGLTNLVVRTTGLTDGANMGIQTGTIKSGGAVALAGSAQVGSMIGGALAGPLGVWIGGAIGGAVSKLWGKTTQNIVDSGLQYGGSVRSLQQGQGFEQYASIDTTKSSFFGLSKSTSNRVEVQGLNDELSRQFGLIFTNLDKSLQAAATAMGGSAADVTKVLDSLTLESTKVSLKGLTGTALTDALNSVISKSMDEIAEAAFPQLDQFRQVGEGYAETVMRIAGDYAKLDAILAASSTSFGATGMASSAARERLIELAGGIDQLASQTNSFTSNFLSKAEQLAPVQKYVTDQLAAMGLQSLDTRDKFKDYVLGLANSGALATEAGAQQYAALLALADAFAKTHAATVDLTKSEQEIADERTDLRNKLDDLTMTQEQLAAKARAAIAAPNLALYDQVQAAQAAKDTLAVLAQLYEVTGNKAGAAALLEKQHADALAGMAPALADATKALWDAQAAAAASKDVLATVSNAYSTLQTVVNKEKDKLNDAYTASSEVLQIGVDAATAAVTKLSSLSQDLHSALDAMAVPGQEKSDRAAAQAKIEAALSIAKAGGPLPDVDSLKTALSTVSKDASSQFSSYIDYMRDLYRTKNNVGALSGLTDSQLSAEQLTLKTLQAQKTALDAAHKEDLAALDKTLEEMKNQTDLLNGVYTSLMTLPQALAALGSAVKAAQADPGVSATSGVAASYQMLLGRAPDAAGLAFWQSQAASGASMEAIYNSIKSSSEYKNLHPFAAGTNYIPGDMPALVHEGERIIPAADNRELMSRLSSPTSSNADLVAELRALRQQVANLENSGARTANACETGTGLWKRVIRNDRVYASTKEEATTA